MGDLATEQCSIWLQGSHDDCHRDEWLIPSAFLRALVLDMAQNDGMTPKSLVEGKHWGWLMHFRSIADLRMGPSQL